MSVRGTFGQKLEIRLDHSAKKKTMLAESTLSLLICLITCLFFAIGDTDRGGACLLQFSISFGYAYGLFLVLQSDEVLKTLTQHYPLLTDWLASVVLTLLQVLCKAGR